MLATLVDEPFDDENWLFEIKWDGYRAIGSVINGKTDLYSRNNISFKEKYTAVSTALEDFSNNVVVDGEIVALAPCRDYRTGEQWKGLEEADNSKPYKIYRVPFLRPPAQTGEAPSRRRRACSR